jgi:DNA-binding CsgD family transcriptional regulator
LPGLDPNEFEMDEVPQISDRDRIAIIAVIKDEIAAWLKRDPAAWADCWLQDTRAQHVNVRPSVGARRLRGFQEINGYLSAIMAELPDSKVQPEDIRLEDWRISIGFDMAWVTFDQVIPLDAPSDSAPGRHHQMRILEKVGGAWKIAAVFHIPNRIGYYVCPWVRVDRSARIIESGAGANEALRDHKSLKVVGQRLVGRVAENNGILKDALIEADDLISLRRGRAPTPLVLSDADASISLCWVSIADMMIVVLLDDEQLLTRSITQAGEVYRLSAAQMRVAEAIARGNDLTHAANLLGVQPNTVRTHVRRMFDRVGVNSQPALIRALLSVTAPKP